MLDVSNHISVPGISEPSVNGRASSPEVGVDSVREFSDQFLEQIRDHKPADSTRTSMHMEYAREVEVSVREIKAGVAEANEVSSFQLDVRVREQFRGIARFTGTEAFREWKRGRVNADRLTGRLGTRLFQLLDDVLAKSNEKIREIPLEKRVRLAGQSMVSVRKGLLHAERRLGNVGINPESFVDTFQDVKNRLDKRLMDWVKGEGAGGDFSTFAGQTFKTLDVMGADNSNPSTAQPSFGSNEP